MTLSEISRFVEDIYPVPVCGTWTPSEYEMKYKFKNAVTPRQIQKLAAETEKQNAKLRAGWEKEAAARDRVFSILRSFESYPAEIASLFWNTLVWTIDDMDRLHDRYLEAKRVLEEFGPYGIKLESLARDFFRRRNYGRGRGKYAYTELTDDNWKKFCDGWGRGEFTKLENGEYGYEMAASRIENWRDYVQAVLDLATARENDPLQAGPLAYQYAVRGAADTLERVAEDIERLLDRRKPDSCETEPNWGGGGKFNGILRAGNDRISFCSFAAGGHNVQRYHFWYKVTKLVEKAA